MNDYYIKQLKAANMWLRRIAVRTPEQTVKQILSDLRKVNKELKDIRAAVKDGKYSEISEQVQAAISYLQAIDHVSKSPTAKAIEEKREKNPAKNISETNEEDETEEIDKTDEAEETDEDIDRSLGLGFLTTKSRLLSMIKNSAENFPTSWEEPMMEIKGSMKVELVPQGNDEYLVKGYWMPDPKFKAEKKVKGLDQISSAIIELEYMILDQKPLKNKDSSNKTSSSINFDKLGRIVKEKGGYYVKSEKGKNLGGPYKTKERAKKRLRQVEYFKHKG
jgi:Arc/MetJ-type ribon-helix-helix transcriptional regulator